MIAAITVSFPRKKLRSFAADARQPLVTPYTRIGLDRWSNWDWQDDIEREGHDFNRGLFYGAMISRMVSSVSLEYAFEWQDHDEGDSDKFHYAGVSELLVLIMC